MGILISGSVAIDNIKTQKDSETNLLGGSASYASISASLFSEVDIFGIVGNDFSTDHINLFKNHKINVDNIEFVEGKTFRWVGEYQSDMNTRETLEVDLNVLESWTPLIKTYDKKYDIILLANSHPIIQLNIIEQIKSNQNSNFIIADTMDLWIQTERNNLEKVLKEINLLVLNDSEAKLVVQTNNIIFAGKKLKSMGPNYVIIKKGEHGSLLFGDDGKIFSLPAYPLDEVIDPTGAGDAFIGAVSGYLSSISKDNYNFEDLKKSTIYGTILGSFTCESFGVKAIDKLDIVKFNERLHKFKDLCNLN